MLADTRASPVMYSVVFWVFMLCNGVRGVNIFLNGSTPEAVLNTEYDLNCFITDISSVSGRVIFLRSTQNIVTMCIVLHQSTTCAQFTHGPGYSCSCVNSSSHIYKMTVANVSLQDEDDWRCQYDGSNSNILSLDVYSPASTVSLGVDGSQPSSMTVLKGRQKNFTCSVYGAKPSPSVQWYREDSGGNTVGSLPGTTDPPQTSKRKTTVVLHYSPDRQHSGQKVYCQAGNIVNPQAVKSNMIKVTFEYHPIITCVPAGPVAKRESESLSINCTADSNPPNPTFTWTSPSRPASRGSQLVISDLNRNDQGIYNVTATVQSTNYGQLAGTATVQVTVNYAPDVTLQNQTRRQGDSITVVCQVNGRPRNYKFSKFRQIWNGQQIRQISGQQVMGTGQYQFTISPISYQDLGLYVCTVENGVAGRDNKLQQTATALLNVQASPIPIGNKGTVVTARVGQSTTLYGIFYSNPQITNTTWQKDGVIIRDKSGLIQAVNVHMKVHGTTVIQTCSNITLLIDSLQEADGGIYHIDVCNMIGCSTLQFNLSVRVMPGAPTNCLCVDHTHTGVTIQWNSDETLRGMGMVRIAFRQKNEANWNNWTVSGVSATSDGAVQGNVTHLHEGIFYFFRVYSRVEPDSNSYCEASCVTINEPTPCECGLEKGMGVGVGIGIAVCAGIIITIVIVLIVCRRRLYAFRRNRNGNGTKSVTNESPSAAITGITSPSSNPTGGEANQYEELQDRQEPEPSKYETLKMYENIGGKETAGQLYENRI